MAKKKTHIIARHLQERNLMHLPLLEWWTSLCIQAQNRLRQQVAYCFLGFMFGQYHHDTPFEKHSRQGANLWFVVFAIYCFLHLGCKGTNKWVKMQIYLRFSERKYFRRSQRYEKRYKKYKKTANLWFNIRNSL